MNVKLASALSGTKALLTLLLAAQVLVSIAPGFLVRHELLVDPFMADC